MKRITIAAVAALTLGWSQVSHAQTAATNSGASAGAGAQAIAGGNTGIGTLVVPGNTGVGGNSGPFWTLGIAPAISSVSYDACLKNFSVSAIAGGINIPLEISHCWALRDMDAMAKFPPGSIQYEHGCLDSNWLKTDWSSGTMACTENLAKLAKSNPNDPRLQRWNAARVPVVSTNMNPTGVPNALPPTVVPVNATNKSISQAPAVDYSRKCNRALGINDQCSG